MTQYPEFFTPKCDKEHTDLYNAVISGDTCIVEFYCNQQKKESNSVEIPTDVEHLVLDQYSRLKPKILTTLRPHIQKKHISEMQKILSKLADTTEKPTLARCTTIVEIYVYLENHESLSLLTPKQYADFLEIYVYLENHALLPLLNKIEQAVDFSGAEDQVKLDTSDLTKSAALR